MAEHVQQFGGPWSLLKVEVVADYLNAYSKALSKRSFTRIYIDAFAGSGSFSFGDDQPKLQLEGNEETVHRGSAKRALEARPGFHEFYFIENKPKNAASLREIAAKEDRSITIVEADANTAVPALCERLDWRNRRGVIFVDPFGPEARWPLLRAIARTKALDVFFLFPLSSVYRNAPRDHKNLTPEKRRAVDQSLWPGWEQQLYQDQDRPEDLFGDKTFTRKRGLEWQQIEQLVTAEMRSIFPHLESPGRLYSTTGSPLFSLYFAVSNPSPAAKAVASPIAKHLLSRL